MSTSKNTKAGSGNKELRDLKPIKDAKGGKGGGSHGAKHNSTKVAAHSTSGNGPQLGYGRQNPD